MKSRRRAATKPKAKRAARKAKKTAARDGHALGGGAGHSAMTTRGGTNATKRHIATPATAARIRDSVGLSAKDMAVVRTIIAEYSPKPTTKH